MKKALSLILALALCLGLAAPVLAMGYGQEYAGYSPEVSQQYWDVAPDHWAFTSIDTCSQRTWFNGYPDGTFRPNNYITREEAAKVFAVAMGLTIQDDPVLTFSDTAGCWARAYIEATKPLFPNVVNLQGTTSFRPTQTITREETIYALVVAWGYGSKTKNADLSILNMFSDARSISAGVKPYVAVAVAEGLVAGLGDGTIAAQKGLTRAEFATLLARALSHGYGDTATEFQAPTITVNRYDTTTSAATATITGTVQPAANVKLTVNGKAVSLNSNGSFLVTVDLELGENTFRLVAENAYGAKDEAAISIRRSNPPSIQLNSYDQTTTQKEVTVSGTVTPSDLTLTLDGKKVSVSPDGSFQLTLTLEQGDNSYVLTATDRYGDKAEEKFTIKFDLPPVTIAGNKIPGDVTVLDLSNRDLTDEDIKPLSQLTSLTELYLIGNKITDLSPLKDLRNLTTLSVNSNPVSDLSPLRELVSLQKLYVQRSQVSDISPVRNLVNLQVLYLSYTQVSDISPLRDLVGLQVLHLYDTKISDISPLRNLVNLQELDFDFTQVSDISPLRNLVNLQGLDFNGTRVSDISPLRNLVNLQELYLVSTQVSDISAVKNMGDLSVLYLNSTQVSDVSPVEGLSKLTGLYLAGCPVTRLPRFELLKNLKSLSVSGCNAKNSALTETDFHGIADLPNLTYLSIGHNHIRDLTFLEGLKKLQTLYLSGNDDILDYTPLYGLTDLKSLYISSKVSAKQLEALRNALPNCDITVE